MTINRTEIELYGRAVLALERIAGALEHLAPEVHGYIAPHSPGYERSGDVCKVCGHLRSHRVHQ